MPDFMEETAECNMKIAVLSGKGGTGKTLVSVNLAAVAGHSTYIDCDVEEPNGHLFFKPTIAREELIMVKIPQVDEKQCVGCRACVHFCNYNALAYVNNRLIIFDDVCHSCGGCVLVCPESALSESDKAIGKIEIGVAGEVNVYTGILNTGEATGIPIINRLLEEGSAEGRVPIFIDCPPGSACIVMESIKDADYCVLVAEPTLFGAHNLNMVYELVKLFDKPTGVVLNKCMNEKNPVEEFCLDKSLEILGRIPFDHELASLNSNAEIVVNKNEKYRELFSDLLETIVDRVERESASHEPNRVHEATAGDQERHRVELEQVCGEKVYGKVTADDQEDHRMELEQVCGEKVYGKVIADDQEGHNAEQEKASGINDFDEPDEHCIEREGANSEQGYASNEMEGGAE
jgi:MinD superfamily P-loop ATPase